jgi:hypothetical protein
VGYVGWEAKERKRHRREEGRGKGGGGEVGGSNYF